VTTEAANEVAQPDEPALSTGVVGRTGHWTRLAAVVVVFGLLLIGTFFGADDMFPFGPFRMYATSNQATGEVAVVALQARTTDSDWTLVRPSPATVGMNVAEFEGQLPRFEDDASLLSAVAASRAALHPDEDPWVGLRIVRQATVVVDKVPTGEVDETILAEWNATGGQS
jgi:hypothetical protein